MKKLYYGLKKNENPEHYFMGCHSVGSLETHTTVKVRTIFIVYSNADREQNIIGMNNQINRILKSNYT